jgi:hypothetical protein
MNREELERLDRDALVSRAEEAGVVKARVLTRPELVDELLLRSSADDATRQRSRGLFGRARDLIARVVERGLHLPDAAERIRALGLSAPTHMTAPAALPTVTLAQIYAAQGHREKALDTLRKVLAREPEHGVAGSLLARLLDGQIVVPTPAMPPEEDAATVSEAESESAPESAPASAPASASDPGSDQCSATLVQPTTLRVSWSVLPSTLEHALRASPGGRLALCVHVVQPTWDGPRPMSTCYEVDGVRGELVARDLPRGCVVRAAVGCLEGGNFWSFAHSGAEETRVAVH